jgi:hypothetical protein
VIFGGILANIKNNIYLCSRKCDCTMNTIKINNTGISVEVSVFLFKEDDVFQAYCPELDLVGYDYTEEGAKKSFEWVLKDYFDYTVENGTLEQDLLNHGWRKTKTGKVAEPTASSLLRRGQLRKVLGKREFSKYSIPVLL